MCGYWEGFLPQVAQELGASRPADVAALLRRRCPEVARQLDDLRQRPELLSLWGLSRNFDEFALEQIVEPGIVEAIGEMAGVSMEGEGVHAGLLHTYGYLFSLIETPFGSKRDRWVSVDLGGLFGLPFDTFCPAPEVGGLLVNLTYFLGTIAFRSYRWESAYLRSLRPGLSRPLRRFPFRRLQCWCVCEKVALPSGPGQEPVVVEIHTDIILPPDADERPEQLLLYWITDEEGHPRLITAFLITADFVEATLGQVTGREVEVSLRFNAYIEGFGESPRLGSRSISFVQWP